MIVPEFGCGVVVVGVIGVTPAPVPTPVPTPVPVAAGVVFIRVGGVSDVLPESSTAVPVGVVVVVGFVPAPKFVWAMRGRLSVTDKMNFFIHASL